MSHKIVGQHRRLARNQALAAEVTWMKQALENAPLGSAAHAARLDLVRSWSTAQVLALARATVTGGEPQGRAEALGMVEAFHRNRQSLITALLDRASKTDGVRAG